MTRTLRRAVDSVPKQLRALLTFLAPLLVLAPGSTSPSGYRAVELRGFEIQVQDVLATGDRAVRERVLEVLDRKLGDIVAALPGAAVTRLRAVTIWVSEGAGPAPCANYHPSADWLRAHGYDARKAKGVEICNASVFLDWIDTQPSMVLHELAHAYHDQVLGYRNKELLRAHLVADASGRLSAVRRLLGNVERHYALNNAQEWFAETTEALFGTNDYFPFVRGELVHVDPAGARLVARLWGADEPRGAHAAEGAAARACAAVDALHGLLGDWCAGRLPMTDEAFGRLEGVFARDLCWIDPDGETLSRADILAHWRPRHGEAACEAAVDRVTSQPVADGLWLVQYRAWQRAAGGQWRGRAASALLREDPSVPGELAWLHVHETWLPELEQLGPGQK
jgi:dipeptidyl-peptidase-4